MILKDQITTIFVQIDDFCKEFDLQIKNLKLNAAGDNKKRKNRSVNNFMINILGGLTTYCFFPKKTVTQLEKSK